ncbi:hypothetical protein [Novosphingobium guangzhouense]|nr:hypothetical protein [Novosphingobium guangzhouense]
MARKGLVCETLSAATIVVSATSKATTSITVPVSNAAPMRLTAKA